MPRGRELADVREALQRLAERFPDGRRRQLPDDTRAVLRLGDEILRITEPAGRGADGEPSPGERVADNASTPEERWHRAALKLGEDGSGMTPGMRAAQSRSNAVKLGYVGTGEQEARRRHRSSRLMVDLEDL